MFKVLLTLIASLFILSCSPNPLIRQDLKIERRYKRDIGLSVNSLNGVGVLVAPKDRFYTIKVKATDKMDALLIQTCHREILIENLSKDYQFAYFQSEGVEDVGSCPMFISSITKDRERIALGMVDFFSGQDLKATLNCSGETIQSQGVSICQAPATLWQEITFEENVKYIEPDGKCLTQIKSDGKKIKYRMPNADCVIVFKGESGKLHKANLIGFDDYVLRGQ